MIIVSQNKKNIYNFDNVKSIDILGNEIYISDDILSDMGTCIAHYETEERAKEVLQEIVKQYKNLITSYQKGRSDYPIETLMFNRNVYEMPVEKVDDK